MMLKRHHGRSSKPRCGWPSPMSRSNSDNVANVLGYSFASNRLERILSHIWTGLNKTWNICFIIYKLFWAWIFFCILLVFWRSCPGKFQELDENLLSWQRRRPHHSTLFKQIRVKIKKKEVLAPRYLLPINWIICKRHTFLFHKLCNLLEMTIWHQWIFWFLITWKFKKRILNENRQSSSFKNK